MRDVIVQHGGFRYVCRMDMTSRGETLRCGKCLRGIIGKQGSVCRVCGARRALEFTAPASDAVTRGNAA